MGGWIIVKNKYVVKWFSDFDCEPLSAAGLAKVEETVLSLGADGVGVYREVPVNIEIVVQPKKKGSPG